MAAQAKGECLGPVLVIGGCGFIGFHIVRLLLLEPDCGPISVVSRDPIPNRHEGVSYYAGDTSNLDVVRKIFADIKLRVIFHTASPRSDDSTITPNDHYNISVQGTRNLLDCATATPSAQAFVYTSTAAVAKGYQHFNVDETAPLWGSNSKTIPYFKAKALADTIIREANAPLDPQGKGLRTATLRLPMVYGERDNQFIPGQLATVQAGQTTIQLGNGQNLVEPVYVGNVATAHILAAKGLLAPTTNPKIDGEAFLISDGDPQPFWDFSRRTWRHAGDTTDPKKVTIIPAWLALSMATGLEWMFFLFTLGKVRAPLKTSRLYIQYTVYNATYNIDKARTRLGYKPVVDHDGNLKRSIQWELENHAERYSNLKVVP